MKGLVRPLLGPRAPRVLVGGSAPHTLPALALSAPTPGPWAGLIVRTEMTLYKYPGYETGQGWTMKPGNLEGGFWGRYKGILGAKPPIFAYWSPQNPPSRFLGFIVHP